MPGSLLVRPSDYSRALEAVCAARRPMPDATQCRLLRAAVRGIITDGIATTWKRRWNLSKEDDRASGYLGSLGASRRRASNGADVQDIIPQTRQTDGLSYAAKVPAALMKEVVFSGTLTKSSIK